MQLKALFVSLTVAGLVYAHGSPSSPFAGHPAEIQRRQHAANARHIKARNCASQVSEYQKERKMRRALRRRGVNVDTPIQLEKRQDLAPHYSTIQNFTCVTAPEAEEGPYYLRNELVRQDLRENITGTPLYLDVGILDTNTCQPATNVFFEIWSCSPQGEYSGFTGSSIGAGGGGAAPSGAPSGAVPSGAVPSSSAGAGGPPSGSGGGAMPTGGMGGGGGGGTKTDAYDWLRGGYFTNENGVVELLTIYPGFYAGRTVHIHTVVHQNVTVSANGTVVSDSGGLRHIGQIFFDDTLNDEVLAQDAYSGTGVTRTYNDVDRVVAQENTDGFNAFIEIERLGDSLDDGLLGYITIGIDTTAEQHISTTNYYEANFVAKREEHDEA